MFSLDKQFQLDFSKSKSDSKSIVQGKNYRISVLSERLVRLNDMAKKQMELLRRNKSLKNLEYIENKVNDKLLIETK